MTGGMMFKGAWVSRKFGYEKYSVSDDRGTEIAFVHRGNHAQLISAAPELLDALMKIGYAPPEGPSGPDLGECVKIARAAIAKALGEEK